MLNQRTAHEPDEPVEDSIPSMVGNTRRRCRPPGGVVRGRYRADPGRNLRPEQASLDQVCLAAPAMLPPRAAWQVLAQIQHVVWTRPDVAYAVRHLTLLDQLELTVELLSDWRETEPELPANIPFRSRRSRSQP
jgi:hypothetical protein